MLRSSPSRRHVGGEDRQLIWAQAFVSRKSVLVWDVVNSGTPDRGVICVTSLSEGSSHRTMALTLQVSELESADWRRNISTSVCSCTAHALEMDQA